MNTDKQLIDHALVYFGNCRRLAAHLGVSQSTPYRWQTGESGIPAPIRLILSGYVAHPARVGEDIVMLDSQKANM